MDRPVPRQPSRRMQRQKASAAENGNQEPATFADSARGTADRLYRAAAECVRQRERYSRLVEAGAHDAEQHAALRIACLCDELLVETADAYESVANREAPVRTEEWRQRASALWHACREYQRRHRDCDERAKRVASRRTQKFQELAVEFDLEASALLALKMAVAAYRKSCPDCELEDHPQTYVA